MQANFVVTGLPFLYEVVARHIAQHAAKCLLLCRLASRRRPVCPLISLRLAGCRLPADNWSAHCMFAGLLERLVSSWFSP
jgi:hypothetical protein